MQSWTSRPPAGGSKRKNGGAEGPSPAPVNRRSRSGNSASLGVERCNNFQKTGFNTLPPDDENFSAWTVKQLREFLSVSKLHVTLTIAQELQEPISVDVHTQLREIMQPLSRAEGTGVYPTCTQRAADVNGGARKSCRTATVRVSRGHTLVISPPPPKLNLTGFQESGPRGNLVRQQGRAR